MNSERSKTCTCTQAKARLTDKLDIRRLVSLSNLSVFYTQTNIKSETNNKISGTTLDEAFELPNGSCSKSDNQDYFDYIIKEHETLSDKQPVQRYVNKIQNRVMFKIESGFQLLTPETMKLVGSTDERITKNKNSEHVPHLENIEVTLVH